MKNFWKKMQDKRLEDFLIDSIFEKTDFCLSFRQIPNPDFVPMFRQKFESEFSRLEAFKEIQ
jgi:hypothetical protein